MLNDKMSLRAEMLRRRSALPLKEAAANAESAQKYLLASSVWANAATVVLYMPIHRELDTGLLRRQAWAEDKRVLFPRCVAGRRGRLELAACGGAADLAPGAYGILEPLPSLPAVDMESGQAPELLVAPCIAVDRRGVRLGYGGGYYDGLLSRPALQATLCIALIHAMQLVPSLPSDPWDMRLHGFCTEEGLLWL